MRTRIRAISVAALALAGCRGDRTPPPAGQQTSQQTQPAGRLEVTLRLPQQLGWNASDTVVVVIANGSAAPVPDAELSLFVQTPVAAPVDSSAPGPLPTSRVNALGTRVKFIVGTVAAGQTVELRQPIRTPPAPAVAAPPAPGQPKHAHAAHPDTSTRFLVTAQLQRADRAPLAATAEDTLRIRAGAAMVVGGCGNANDAVVTRYGIGPVRVGMPVDALRAACPEARDTTWRGQEGTAEHGVVVMPGGRRVVAVMTDSAVTRILIDQPGVRTAAGIEVGTTVAGLRGRFGRMCAGTAERQIAVWFPNQPGLSFGLDTAATKGWTPAQANPDSVPDGVKVTSMWVRKGSDDCPARPGEGGR
ncbi:hypothetical protein [Longimicrobium sp.]|uniref:hypothetical protein n=1 Tax=Longimicrobium sp. TaxID=2029185 RepID=UPI002BA120F2|nr:hypothetical protein [Longimicrobium sp.]HSU16126.1 hypothetical protein [Longimicrobium sp.]